MNGQPERTVGCPFDSVGDVGRQEQIVSGIQLNGFFVYFKYGCTSQQHDPLILYLLVFLWRQLVQLS